jgi:hypothetical protein
MINRGHIDEPGRLNDKLRLRGILRMSALPCESQASTSVIIYSGAWTKDRLHAGHTSEPS